jgi:O-acetyl-ADP-ribose deacetylase (regulator of RNase III)
MISRETGSLFDSNADALVVPVNCVGVAGAGLALEFRLRYPHWFAAYRSICLDSRPYVRAAISIGKVWAYKPSCAGPSAIVSFPTKRHWKLASSLDYIEDGLDSLRAWLIDRPQVESIAVPALGCGLGGLPWADVRPLIEKSLGDLETTVLVYGPQDGPEREEAPWA